MDTPTIKIPYRPRRWARLLHLATTRWIVLVLHRRAGKTTSAINHLQRDAMRNVATRYAYIAPTQKQAKRIVWAMAKHYAENIPGVQFNNSELLITYPNGSEIMVLGSDNPDSLRGIKLWGCFLDEYPQQNPIIFTEIVTKCLADTQGYCIFGGTPKGKGHFFSIFSVAQKYPEDYLLIYKTIDDSLKEETGEVVDNLRKSLRDDKKLVEHKLMTEDEFQQEWYCSFEAAIKGAVYLKEIGQARKDKRIFPFSYDSTLPVYTVWDLGISKGNAMSIGFFQRSGREVWMIDYYENIGEGLPHYIKYVKEKPYVYGKHFAPHDIKKRELSTGKTLLDTALKLGITFEVVPSVGLQAGIQQARGFWSKVFIDSENCEWFLNLIGLYHFKFDDERRIYGKEPEHDWTSNGADMFRYAAVVEDEMTIEEDTPPPASLPQLEDEFMGQEDIETRPTGFGSHPMTRKIDIGKMGSKPVDKSE